MKIIYSKSWLGWLLEMRLPYWVPQSRTHHVQPWLGSPPVQYQTGQGADSAGRLDAVDEVLHAVPPPVRNARQVIMDLSTMAKAISRTKISSLERVRFSQDDDLLAEAAQSRRDGRFTRTRCGQRSGPVYRIGRLLRRLASLTKPSTGFISCRYKFVASFERDSRHSDI